MLKKVEKIIADGNPAKIDEVLLESYRKNLANRIVQVDRGESWEYHIGASDEDVLLWLCVMLGDCIFVEGTSS